MDIKNKFFERLKELRDEKQLSINELAKEVGFSPIAISRWERKERIPNVETLYIFCEYFSVSADYLIGIDGV